MPTAVLVSPHKSVVKPGQLHPCWMGNMMVRGASPHATNPPLGDAKVTQLAASRWVVLVIPPLLMNWLGNTHSSTPPRLRRLEDV